MEENIETVEKVGFFDRAKMYVKANWKKLLRDALMIAGTFIGASIVYHACQDEPVESEGEIIPEEGDDVPFEADN